METASVPAEGTFPVMFSQTWTSIINVERLVLDYFQISSANQTIPMKKLLVIIICL